MSLDSISFAPVSQKALSRMLPYFREKAGSLSSPHFKGQSLFPAYEEAYRTIYKSLHASEKDIFIFTGSAAEGMAQVVQSIFEKVSMVKGKNHFITSTIEEAHHLMALHSLEAKECVVKMVKPNAFGIITGEAIAEAMSPRTALVSLSMANAMTGVTHEIEEIAKVCEERGVFLHLDISSVLGKFPVQMSALNAHYLTWQGDKVHAPPGTGGLLVKQNAPIIALISGGSEQGGLRAGNVNMPGLVGLAEAALEWDSDRDYLLTEISRLRDLLEENILKELPDTKIFYRDSMRLPHVTMLGFPGILNEALLFVLNQKGVFASIGGGSYQQARLLLEASGTEKVLAETAISFSLSRETTEKEIEEAVKTIIQSVQILKKTAQYIL